MNERLLVGWRRVLAASAVVVLCLGFPAVLTAARGEPSASPGSLDSVTGGVSGARPLVSGSAAPQRQLAAEELESDLGRLGLIDLDRRTGTPRIAAKLDGYLTGPDSRSPQEIARAYVRDHESVFGLSADDLAGVKLTRSWSDSGYTHLIFTQALSGIPLIEGGLTANVSADGRLINLGGSPLPGLRANTLDPSISAAAALEAAFRDAGAQAPAGDVRRLPGPRRETRVGARTSAKLVLVPSRSEARLAWRVIGGGSAGGAFATVVDAVTGTVLRRQSLSHEVNARVFPHYPGAAVGGSQTTVDITPYVTSPGNAKFFGNFAYVFTDVNDNGTIASSEEIGPSSGNDYLYTYTPFSVIGGNCVGTGGCSWDHTTAFSWQTNRRQAGTQAFYFVNRFHDHLLASPIEFTRAKGNFEGVERVWVDADEGANTNAGLPDDQHINNAYMSTYPFGTPPLMALLLMRPAPGNAASTVGAADDPSIVYHEYTHGLTERLVSDADGVGLLDGNQARALSEAWSDWYAMDKLAADGLVPDTATAGDVKEARFVDRGENIWRSQGFDCEVGDPAAACPGTAGAGSGGYTYGDMGKVETYPEPHADGEIWAETLWDLRRLLIAEHGSAEGLRRARLLVTRGLELTPARPSFLDARNAIVQADAVFNGGADSDIVWQAFANRGMGWFASTRDTGDTKPVESFLLPPVPGGATGTIAGAVTTQQGAPVANAKVWVGGHDSGFADDLETSTTAGGTFTITGVPVGTYTKIFASAPGGYDVGVASNVSVAGGTTTPTSFALRRDWASSLGGASISSFTGPNYSQYLCGPSQAIDGSFAFAWVTTSPVNADAPGSKSITIALPGAVDIASIGIDPTAGCNEGITTSLGSFLLETSQNGTVFQTAATGTFTQADTFQLNTIAPAPGTGAGVRFVRLTAQSTQNQTPPFRGSVYMSVTEVEVYSNTPPAGPSNLTALALSRSQIGLAWSDNSTNETGFRIERSWNGISDWHQIGTVAAGVTTYTHARQPALTTYFYRVRATNAVGDSTYSNVASATTLG